MAFVIGVKGSPETIVEEFEVDDEGLILAHQLGAEIEKTLGEHSVDKSVLMAALAQVGANLSNPKTAAKERHKGLKKVS